MLKFKAAATYEKMELLKEPLISDPTEMGLKNGFLDSFIKGQQFESSEEKKTENNIEEHEQNFEKVLHQQRSRSDYRRISDPSAVKLPNYYELNKDLFIDTLRNDEEGIERVVSTDPFSFFKQATAQHKIPVTRMVAFTFQKTDPSIFAVVSQASPYFKHIMLKELICLQDYKVLQKIRVRNYIYILKMLAEADRTDIYCRQVWQRLKYIEGLCIYLEVLNERKDRNDKDREFDEIFLQFESGYHLIQDNSQKEFDNTKNEYFPDEDSDEDGEESDDYNSEADENEELFDFYEKSDLLDAHDEYEKYNQALYQEEEKWVNRAIWLEQQIEKFKADTNLKVWVPWFEAKFEQLQDLDINIKGSDKVQQSNQVFYVHQFVKECIDEQKDKNQLVVDEDDFGTYIRNSKYTKDMQVYVERQNLYPSIHFEQKNATNSNIPEFNTGLNFREKLCLKVMARESQTDYFLTVFKKKELGNEKIYEKRLNFNGRKMDIRKLEFQPGKGQFILLSVQKHNTHPTYHHDDYEEEDSNEEENEGDEDEGEKSEEKDEESKDEDEEDKEGSEKKSENKSEDKGSENKGDDENGNDGEKNWEDNQYTRNTLPKKVVDPCNTIDLIFNIEAQFKNPLFIKPKTTPLGFYGEKHFYALQKNLKLSKNQKITRVYEYDLYNFEKIRVQDLSHEKFLDFTDEEQTKGLIGKVKDGGFYRIYSNVKDKDTTTFHLLKGSDVYDFDNLPKNEKYIEEINPARQTNKNSSTTGKSGEGSAVIKQYVSINERGDKVLMVRTKDNNIQVLRFVQDSKAESGTKSKKLKLDTITIDTKVIEGCFEKDTQGSYFKIIPTHNDFIILGNNQTLRQVYVFQMVHVSDTLIEFEIVTKFNCNIEDLYFNIVDQKVQTVYEVKEMSKEVALKCNNFMYQMWDKESKDWYSLTHEIINQQKHVHFPYAYFLYNHDQLYIKDLTQTESEGYFYMNHFLGISKRERPMTVNTFNQWGNMVTNVLIVDSRYNSNSFYLRMNQFFGSPAQQQPDKLANSFLFYQVYSFNEGLRAAANTWASVLTDAQGQLESDVRIRQESNSLKIEKFKKGKCFERIYMSHYSQSHDRKERDISQPWRCDRGSLAYEEEVFKLFVFIKQDSFTIYRKNLKDATQEEADFLDQNLLDTVHEEKFDDQSNPVIDVFIDTLPLNKIDIYLLYQNYKMKKLTATIPFIEAESNAITFDQSTDYLVDDLLSAKDKQGTQMRQAVSAKELKVFKLFIANSVLYSKCDTIELPASGNEPKVSTVMNCKDLTAAIKQGKMIVGNKVTSPFEEGIEYLGYSCNEGRLALNKPCDSSSNDLFDTLIVSPLFNTRVLPQFNHQRFNHGVAPLVYPKGGYSTVFSLSLRQTIYNELQIYTNYYGQLYYLEAIGNFEQNQNCTYLDFYNVSPGLIIKFFNGIEYNVPLKEKILRVDRFNISKDGRHVVIQGLVPEAYANDTNFVALRECILIYEIDDVNYNNIELIDKIYFKDTYHESPIQKLTDDEEKKVYLAHSESNDIVLNEYQDDQESNDSQYFPKFNKDLYYELDKEQDELKQEIAEALSKQPKTQYETVNNKALPGFNLPSMRQAYFSSSREPEDNYEADVIKSLCKQIPMINFGKDYEYLQIDYHGYLFKEKLDTNESEEQRKENVSNLYKYMKTDVNNVGHIFFIDQLFDQIYFVFQNKAGKRQCYNFKFASNFQVTGADSTDELVVIYSKTQILIYNIKPLIENGAAPIQINNSDLNFQIQEPPKPKVQEAKKINNQIDEENKHEKTEEEKQEDENKDEKSLATITAAYLYRRKLMIMVDEDGDQYFKIMDIDKRRLLNYIEYDQVLISGDKQFAWFPTQDKVFDIANNLSTLFFWPGDQISTNYYTSYMDNFTVNFQRTIMGTHGCLQLSFNYLSAMLDTEELEDILQPEKQLRFPTRPLQLCYNLPGNRSVIRRILHKPHDTSNFKFSFQQRDYEFAKEEGEAQQQMQYLVNFLSNFSSQLNPILVTCFFLSYSSTRPATKYSSEDLKIVEETLEDGKTVLQNIFEVLFSHKNMRRDLIEEIQRFVVKSLELPISQQVMNKSFIQFLEVCDTSTAFREYLENGIMKTSKMEQCDKYSIEQRDDGLVLKSHITPLMDKHFDEKFQDKQEAKKDVSISYIYLNDLLNERGICMMKTLSDIKFLPIMNIPFIKNLVNYQWTTVQENIKVQTLYPFYTLLALFTMFSFQIDFEEDIIKFKDWAWYSYPGYMVLCGLLLTNILYFLTIEYRQARVSIKEYLSSFWNLTDLISYSLCAISVLFEMFDFNKHINRPIVATTVIILWIKLFYFLRVYDSTSQLIRMIIEIVRDMKYFMFVLLIGIIGFTAGLFVLQKGINTVCADENDAECQAEAEGNDFVGNNAIKAFIYTYRLTLGDFQLDDFAKFEEKGLIFEFYYLWFIFIFGSLFLVIVLLNLLIAIMGSTFEKVNEQLENLSIREKALLVSENESLFSREKLFNQAQYLIVIQEKKIEGSQEEDVQENISKLKAEISGKVDNLESELKSQIIETHTELKRKLVELDERTAKINEVAQNTHKQQMETTIDAALQKINQMWQQQQQSFLKAQQMQFTEQGKYSKKLEEKMEMIQSEQRQFASKVSQSLKLDAEGPGKEE